MEKIKENKRIKNKASQTALMAAIYRHLATKERKFKLLGTDNMAYMFIPSKVKFALSATLIRKLITKKLNKKSPGSYPYVVARTRFFDELFLKEAKLNIPQIVFFGAGFDTRSLRFQSFLNNSNIFELDLQTTQEEKIKILNENKITFPDNIHYIPIDFNADDLKQSLFSAGYDAFKRTLFIWEGVTMYLAEEAVLETLNFVKNNSGPGSVIAFDYLYKSVIRNECSYYGAEEISEIVQNSGESFTFGVEEGQIESFLFKKGFTILSHNTPNKIQDKYLTNKDGLLLGRPYGFASYVLASK